jgi:hypothetical protein
MVEADAMIAAKPMNWCSFDPTALPIDVATDPTPPAAAAMLAAINAVVQGVAVTPYVGTGHLCWRHGYVGGGATTAVQLYFSASIAPGAVHAKFASTDRMLSTGTYVTPQLHYVWTQSGGVGAADQAVLPMYPPPGNLGNLPDFWIGKQYPVESSETIDDAPVAAINRMLEVPSVLHPVVENCYCSAVMAWSFRVTHTASDLASL